MKRNDWCLKVASFTEAWIEIEAATLDGETLGSPPSRRRGLKLLSNFMIKMEILSPPSRRRGLKWQEGSATEKQTRSPPSRRRGLKFKKADAEAAKKGRLLHGGVDWNSRSTKLKRNLCVASFTEAWIEINLGKNENEGEQVASFTEAWIEISYKLYTCTSHSSPPSRRRGLKSA